MDKFKSTFEYKLIYVFTINDSIHRGYLKVGDATLHTDLNFTNFSPNCHELNYAAKSRIADYTSTAGINAQLLYTEIAVYINKKGDVVGFKDHAVHDVLKRSGVKNKQFDALRKQNEWFECPLSTVVEAIRAVKNEESAISGSKVSQAYNPILFRPEQEEAIKKTIQQFTVKRQNHMLWNAKMRFGKTLCALEVIKRLGLNKAIIITHRPDVDTGWFEDFNKIFYEPTTKYKYGSDRGSGCTLKELLSGNSPFVYFTSIQNLRGSIEVGGKYPKNDDVFDTNWNLVITDEAHEGTQTELGKKVRDKLIHGNTKELSLSGTPFNLFDLYSQEDTFTWDYISEQKAKHDWMRDPYKLGDSNPYDDLPKMNLFTYHLERLLPNNEFIEDKAFNFKEFFRVWTGDEKKDGKDIPSGKNKGDFIHEEAVKAFLDLLCKKDSNTNYPFSTDLYRDYFRHTLWMIPGVKEAKALSALLQKHPVFGNGSFEIVNVAGEGDYDPDKERKALNQLRKKITSHPENTRTITLSCGRLTTGVTVKEWTAVLMLSGSYVTDAKQYLQTIFRVQSPATINGKVKQNCYVFDFAPDRTLRVVYDAVKKMSQRRNPPIECSALLGEFLNFCPVISLDTSEMITFKAEQLIQEIKRVYTERVVDSGFEDNKLYNDELLRLDGIELEKFDNLRKIIGKTNQTKKPSDVDLVKNGLTDEQRKELEDLEKKRREKAELTQAEKEKLAERKKLLEQRTTAISILRGISIRIPLLVYGIDKDFDYDISIDEFCDLVDDDSWKEFMPEGVTKDIFRDFIKYYDKDIFLSACRSIRSMSKNADELEPTDRIKAIAELFSKFKNPDKETVLTPWRVVNLHMSSTIGGYDFWNAKHSEEIDAPRYVNKEGITSKVFEDPNSKVLEINSKTGLYPLYIAYSFYRNRCKGYDSNVLTFDKKQNIWDLVVKDNVFVICKTPMAKLITQRTLMGYRKGKINAHAFDDLINQLKSKEQQFVDKITSCSFWNRRNDKMKFTAVVGNPPYQGTNHQQIYPFFYNTSLKLGHYVSLIFPTGWQQPKNANSLSKMNNEKVKYDHEIHFIDNRQNVFPGISGAEWVNIIFWEKGFDNDLQDSQLILTNGENGKVVKLLIEDVEKPKPKEIKDLATIVMETKGFVSASSITSPLKPYGLRTDVITDNKKYNLPALRDQKESESDILIYAKSGVLKYVSKDFPFPKITPSFHKWKVFVPYAWGNMSEKTGLGGAYSDIIIGRPNEACTETYLESGKFDDFATAQKHAKYLMTKFARALLYLNKFSQHSTTAWGAVPVQDYHEDWWELSIKDIDEKLFEKYSIPNEIKKFVFENIQAKNESHIINFLYSQK